MEIITHFKGLCKNNFPKPCFVSARNKEFVLSIQKAGCPGPIATNVYVYDGLGFRSAYLSHVAERN